MKNIVEYEYIMKMIFVINRGKKGFLKSHLFLNQTIKSLRESILKVFLLRPVKNFLALFLRIGIEFFKKEIIKKL